MESRPSNAVHRRKSVIFYPVIPIRIVTAVDTAMALTECLLMDTTINDVDLVDITKI